MLVGWGLVEVADLNSRCERRPNGGRERQHGTGRVLESRTARPPLGRSATSTQAALPLLRADLRQRTWASSMMDAFLSVLDKLRDHGQALVAKSQGENPPNTGGVCVDG